jgi:hypothetical protein
MFNSISLATPNVIATSSFVATESCVIDISTDLPVRVNNLPVTTRPINLVSGNTIQVDVLAPDSEEHLFVPYTYNGNECYFGVISFGGSTKVTLKNEYIGFIPSDLPVTGQRLNLRLSSANVESTVFNTGGGDGTPQDRIAFMGGPNPNDVPYIAWYRTNGTQLTRDFPNSAGVDATNVFDNGSRSWDQYYLLASGKIYKVPQNYASSYSTAVYSNAKTIFSDTVSLFVGGLNYLHVLSDMNTIGQTFTLTDETVYGGAALGFGAIVSTNKGKLYKLTGSGLELLYQSKMIGKPAAFNNQYIVPVPTEWALRIYDQDFNLIDVIDTGERIPLFAKTSRSALTVTHASSYDVAIYSDMTLEPQIKTFSKYITFATYAATNTFATTHLSAYEMLAPAIPTININIPEKLAPANVDVGSGEYVLSTEGIEMPFYGSPNTKVLLDRTQVESGVVNTGSIVSAILRSNNSKANGVLVVGYFAFDFKVNGDATEYMSRYLEVPAKAYAPSVTFNLVVPEEVVNSPIALSHGLLSVNGTIHNGVSKVKSGDTLTITLHSPDNQDYYYSMLSFADAQYALVVNTSDKTIKDLQRYQAYGNLTTMSTLVVDEAGSYDLPNYTNVKVYKEVEDEEGIISNVELSFPTELEIGDKLHIRHVKVSSMWLDLRDTVLIGPSRNYVVQSRSKVNDMPENINFGTIHMGIPDFDFEGDLEPSIAGLSSGYSIEIYADHMKFRVNGSAPQSRPLVKNGDKLRAVYTVQNLFDIQAAKTLLSDGETVYEFGFLHIDPALGQTLAPRSAFDGHETNWKFLQEHPEGISTSLPQITKINQGLVPASVGSFDTQTMKPTKASVPHLTARKQLSSAAPLGKYNTETAATALVERGARFTSTTDLAAQLLRETIANSTIARSGALVRPMMVPTTAAKSETLVFDSPAKPTFKGYRPQTEMMGLDKTDTYVPLQKDHEMSFGRSANFQTFIPAFDYEASAVPVSAMPFFVFNNDPSDREFWPNWFVFEYENTSERDMEFEVQTRSSWTTALVSWLVPIGAQNVGAQTHWTREIGNIAKRDLIFDTEVRSNEGRDQLKAKPAIQASAAAVYSPSVVYASASTSSHTIKGKTAPELYSASNNTAKAGGYSTHAQAEEAAAAYTSKLETEVYQQPEGTFSFIVKRDTGLVCEVKNSGFTVVAWLIGGG